jgi:methylated-DNA-[protein]-cysteine S-methyltransferase
MPTKFSEKIYTKLRKVPKGKITTYKALARAVGSKACRAVGTAMNKNPYSPSDGGDVCCHRVVNSDGRVGGFASGTANKIKLLKREGIPIKAGRIVDFEKYLYRF